MSIGKINILLNCQQTTILSGLLHQKRRKTATYNDILHIAYSELNYKGLYMVDEEEVGSDVEPTEEPELDTDDLTDDELRELVKAPD